MNDCWNYYIRKVKVLIDIITLRWSIQSLLSNFLFSSPITLSKLIPFVVRPKISKPPFFFLSLFLSVRPACLKGQRNAPREVWTMINHYFITFAFARRTQLDSYNLNSKFESRGGGRILPRVVNCLSSQ